MCAPGKEARTVAIAGVERTKSPIRSVRESRILTIAACVRARRNRLHWPVPGPSATRRDPIPVARQRGEPAPKARLEMQTSQNRVKPALYGVDSSRQIRAPMRMAPHELHGSAGLRSRLRNHLLNVRPLRARLEMVDERSRVKDRPNARESQAQSDVDVLPAILRERFVKCADGADRRERHGNVRRPKIVAAVVRNVPDRRRQIVEIVHLDRAAANDRARDDDRRRVDALGRSSGAARRRRR